MRKAYDAALEAEGQGCCAVSDLDRAAGVGVVIGHSTEESSALDRAKDRLLALIVISAKRLCFGSFVAAEL